MIKATRGLGLADYKHRKFSTVAFPAAIPVSVTLLFFPPEHF